MSDLKRRVKWNSSDMNRNDMERTEVDLWVSTAESRTRNVQQVVNTCVVDGSVRNLV